VIIGLHHVAVCVPDLDAGLAFYVEALGAEVVFRSHLIDRPDAEAVIGLVGVDADVAMVKLGAAHVELWTYRTPAPQDLRSPANALGYPHIALAVRDIDVEHTRLSAAGMTFVGPPVDLGWSRAVYGRDPFGNLIELYELLDD
jgi:catechol 2,3-dioxygenase-like lactoylglutathione lyase family enzyme